MRVMYSSDIGLSPLFVAMAKDGNHPLLPAWACWLEEWCASHWNHRSNVVVITRRWAHNHPNPQSFPKVAT